MGITYLTPVLLIHRALLSLWISFADFWRKFSSANSLRHKRWHIAPQVEASVVIPSFSNPLLRTSHILDNHWNVVTSGLYSLTLDAELRVE